MDPSPQINEPVVLRARPHRKRSFRRDAGWALLLVVVLEVLTLWAETMPWWERYTLPFHDLLMRTWNGQDIHPATARQLAFIDIDDTAFDHWGMRGVTDRERLRDLIRFAAEGEASLIVVDLDLSFPDPSDAELRAWLRDYHRGPNLIFSRPIGPATPRENAAWEVHPSVIDQAIAGNPLVHFATAAFTADADGSLRRWRLWEVLCENSRPVAMPSVELLALAIIDDPNDGAEKLSGILNGAVRGQCEQVEPGMARDPLTFKHFPRLELYPDPHGEHILFTQPWPVPLWDEQRLAYLPALQIVEKHPSADRVRGRIVVIGGSNAASRDLVQTPIGAMPGAMVLLNSMNALFQQGQLRPPPWWLALSIGVVMGMGVWLCLYVFQFALALVIATAFVFVATWLVASSLIGSGIWLDMAVPSFGVLLHRWWTVFETIWHTWPTHGWRALLAERFHRGPAILILAAGLTAAWAGTARSDDQTVAGHISAIEGDTANFVIERGGTRIPARYWANVFDGDVIIVTGPGRIEIAPNGPMVTRATSPATVMTKGPTPLVQVFAEKFGWILNQFSNEENRGNVKQTMSRDLPSPMTLALLQEPDHQHVVAGMRQFTLAWTGGRPPFTATLTTTFGTVTLAPEPGGTRRASALLRLATGRYEARVTDARAITRSAQFDVVASAPVVSEAAVAGAPVDVQVAMAAMELARIDGGRWRLEAFERLAEAAPRYYVARLLASRLAAGRSLDSPE